MALIESKKIVLVIPIRTKSGQMATVQFSICTRSSEEGGSVGRVNAEYIESFITRKCFILMRERDEPIYVS